MTEPHERRGFDELRADDAGRVSLRHVRPDDARFREACDHLIGEGADCPTFDRLDRIEQQAREMEAMRGGALHAVSAAFRCVPPLTVARVMATWPGGIGEIPEG